MEILASCEMPLPPADRATLRRFRHIVADLGNDLYVATVDERLVGVVHASYARQVTTYPLARIELLAVAPPLRRQGVGAALVRHIEDRARQRACVRASCDLSGVTREAVPEIAAFFARLGWTCVSRVCAMDLASPPGADA